MKTPYWGPALLVLIACFAFFFVLFFSLFYSMYPSWFSWSETIDLVLYYRLKEILIGSLLCGAFIWCKIMGGTDKDKRKR